MFLDFVDSQDEVVEFMFEVMAAAVSFDPFDLLIPCDFIFRLIERTSSGPFSDNLLGCHPQIFQHGKYLLRSR